MRPILRQFQFPSKPRPLLCLALACLLTQAAPAISQTAASAASSQTSTQKDATTAAASSQASASSASESSDAPVQAVFIAGGKDPDWKTYRAFVAGIDVYENRRKLAPQAPLHFLLRPQQAGTSFKGLTLHISGDNTSIAVPIDAQGIFTLPKVQAALDDKAELVLNRQKGLFRWRPDIHSPGVPANTRRLGDLRLECEVRWAVEQEEVPYLMRKVFNAVGGACHSADIQVDFLSARPVKAMHLAYQGKRKTLPASAIEAGGHIYMPPVHDLSWDDDSLLEFEFVD